MLLLTMILTLSVSFGQTYPTGPYYAEGETPEETVFRILQDLDLLPSPGPPVSKPSALLQPDVSSPPVRTSLPKSAWGWHPEMLHPEMKRRQNLAAYNLNSFGLRYGK